MNNTILGKFVALAAAVSIGAPGPISASQFNAPKTFPVLVVYMYAAEARPPELRGFPTPFERGVPLPLIAEWRQLPDPISVAPLEQEAAKLIEKIPGAIGWKYEDESELSGRLNVVFDGRASADKAIDAGLLLDAGLTIGRKGWKNVMVTAAVPAATDKPASSNGDFAPPAPAVTPEEFARKAGSLFLGGNFIQGRMPALGYGRALFKPQAVPTDDELKKRVNIPMLNNAQREEATIELYKFGGASYDPATAAVKKPDWSRPGVIQTQDVGRGRRNIMVYKQGATDRLIVLGGHLDAVPGVFGIIDNWSGNTAQANVHQVLAAAATRASYLFVGFAREEEGLIGSRRLVSTFSKADRERVIAMVNVDTVGGDGTYGWWNPRDRDTKSDEWILKKAEEAAAAQGLDFQRASLDGGDSDSTSFRDAGMFGTTLFGLSPEKIFKIIHTENDNIANFSFPHYKNALLVTLALLEKLDLMATPKPST